MGCRRGRFGRVDSLLLTEPFPRVESLTVWIAREWDDEVRNRILTDVGALLRRLHEACCHLPDLHFPLALQRESDGSLRPVLTGADGLLVTRAPSPSLVARNLAVLAEALRSCGATAPDLRVLLEGYTDAGEPMPANREEVAAAPTEQASLHAHSSRESSESRSAVASLQKATTMQAFVVAARSAARSALPPSRCGNGCSAAIGRYLGTCRLGRVCR